jgi:hypothetical protein
MDSSPPPSEPPFSRFSALVKRELGADDVRILEPQSPPSEAPNVLCAPLLGGRHVVASFAATPANAPALLRRLEILVRTFAHALEEPAGERPPRPRVPMSLHDELRALAQRARATDAVVLDAHSPVMWGSAISKVPRRHVHTNEELGESFERLEESRRALLKLIQELPPDPPSTEAQDVPPPAPVPSRAVILEEDEGEETPELSLRAIREVRELPGIAALRRGRPVVHVARESDFGYVARSFAGIYLVVLIFDAPFDELRAERVLIEALPKVERLVLALPPIDPGPAPTANVLQFRRRRR